MSINWWMDKDSVASLYNGLLFGNILQHGWISKALCWVKEARCERTLLHDSVCIKCPAKANIQRQKTEEWLPGAQRGGHKGWMQAGTGILGSHGKCSKIESWWWLHNLVNLLKIMIELYTKLSECYGPSTTLKKKKTNKKSMSLADRWCRVYNLAEVAQLNNGVIWLRGKCSVLALAAHDLLVLLCW